MASSSKLSIYKPCARSYILQKTHHRPFKIISSPIYKSTYLKLLLFDLSIMNKKQYIKLYQFSRDITSFTHKSLAGLPRFAWPWPDRNLSLQYKFDHNMIHKNNMLWYTWNNYRDNYIANYRIMSTRTSTNVIISVAKIN